MGRGMKWGDYWGDMKWGDYGGRYEMRLLLGEIWNEVIIGEIWNEVIIGEIWNEVIIGEIWNEEIIGRYEMRWLLGDMKWGDHGDRYKMRWSWGDMRWWWPSQLLIATRSSSLCVRDSRASINLNSYTWGIGGGVGWCGLGVSCCCGNWYWHD